MSTAPVRLALVLMGGGARVAYQVGALKLLVELAREIQPGRPALPFTVLCGTSAGAVNAASLAAHADDFARGVAELTSVWGHFHADQVYRTDWPGVMRAGARWLGALAFGWALRRSPGALFDNTPLAHLLRRRMHFDRIDRMLETRRLHALAVTALSYSSGQHLTFYRAAEPIQNWRRAQRTARMVELTVDHLLASAAIPFVFPAVPLAFDGAVEYFGDGSIRQMAPLSPAIHFGATRILVLGASTALPEMPVASGRAGGYPSLAQIGQQVMASVFLDSLAADIERVDNVNRLVSHLPDTAREGGAWRHIDVLALAPSQRLEMLAVPHIRRLPLTIRGLLGAVGGDAASGASFASYLLFEADYTRELMALGYRDALARRDELRRFIAVD